MFLVFFYVFFVFFLMFFFFVVYGLFGLCLAPPQPPALSPQLCVCERMNGWVSGWGESWFCDLNAGCWVSNVEHGMLKADTDTDTGFEHVLKFWL